MSRKDALTLASRTLALLLTVWALAEASSLPECVHSYLHYMRPSSRSPDGSEYLRHYYLIRTGFLFAKVAGFALMARWLFKGGVDVEELFLPTEVHETPSQN